MSVSALSAKQKRAARLFAAGAKQKDVAAELGVDTRTVRRWQRLERFPLEVERAGSRAIAAKAYAEKRRARRAHPENYTAEAAERIQPLKPGDLERLAEPKLDPALLAREERQRRWSRHAPVFQTESERYDYYEARAHLSENDVLNWHDVRAGRLTPYEKRAIRAAEADVWGA
jgi:hypothetical protein